MEGLASLMILAAVGAAVWVVFAGPGAARYDFLVRIEAGRIVVQRGRVGPEFIEALEAAVADYRVGAGWVGGLRSGGRSRLEFASALPPGFRQRVRNAWALDN